MNKDWLFRDGENICSFRSAGVLIKEGKILLQREKAGSEYALPGGHVAIGEDSRQTLIREFKEETGADILCKKLIWAEECFWKCAGKDAHTVIFYYIVELKNDNDIPDSDEFTSQKDNCDVLLGWVPLTQLKSLTAYPSFLKEQISDLSTFGHFVTRE